MFYDGLAVVVIILGLLTLFFAAKVLLDKLWILGWLRGSFGLLLLGFAVIFGLAALDIFSYRQLTKEQSIATVSFEVVDTQRFKAILVDAEGSEQRFNIAGDQWQLDARIIKWPASLSALGVKPGYRLDRISGRYYSLEKERQAERTIYDLSQSEYAIDVWSFFREYKDYLPVVDAVYGSATYLPMADGALYEVLMSNSGLLARPLNERAQEAVSRWQ